MQDLQTESGEATDKHEKKSVKLPKFGENLSGDEEDDYSDGEGTILIQKLFTVRKNWSSDREI